MAKNPKTAIITRNLAVDAGVARCNAGKFRIYSGTQPTDADTAIGAQVLLAELTYAATAYGAATGGVATAAAITSDAAADATGTAAWARHTTSAGVAVFDCAVGGTQQGDSASTTDLLLNTTAIVIGAQVSCSSFTYTLPA